MPGPAFTIEQMNDKTEKENLKKQVLRTMDFSRGLAGAILKQCEIIDLDTSLVKLAYNEAALSLSEAERAEMRRAFGKVLGRDVDIEIVSDDDGLGTAAKLPPRPKSPAEFESDSVKTRLLRDESAGS